MQKIKHLLSSVAWKLQFPSTRRNFKRLIALVIIVAVIFGVKKIADNRSTPVNDLTISEAKASQLVGRELAFPLLDEKGNEVSKVRYIIENVEKRDEIVVKGQKARSVKGRTFLIFNLKIVNDFNQVIEIQTRDYVRLSVNGDKNQWLAPDIHNDPVEIQAISTKLTRIGFAINDSDKDLILRVGEIGGEKQEIEIKI